jgi:hypothetical protein
VNNYNCCSDQHADDDGDDKKNDISAHVNLLWAKSNVPATTPVQ